MDCCIVTFYAVYHAYKAEKVLKSANVAYELIPSPREYSPDCVVALRFASADKPIITRLIKEHGIEIGGMFPPEGDEHGK